VVPISGYNGERIGEPGAPTHDAFLAKPMNMASLLRCVRRVGGCSIGRQLLHCARDAGAQLHVRQGHLHDLWLRNRAAPRTRRGLHADVVHDLGLIPRLRHLERERSGVVVDIPSI
jgi:hypothetical protein